MKITEQCLELLVKRLNVLTRSPLMSWERIDGQNVANIGNYHLSYAYGGVSLHRMHNTGGGVEDVFSCGHIPKRELYYRISAFMAGIETDREE